MRDIGHPAAPALKPAAGRTIQTYSWNFGEPSSGSNSSSLQNPAHTYNAAGTYNVTLTVIDDVGVSTIGKALHLDQQAYG